MTHNPSIDLATSMAANVAGLTLGSNLFHSTVRNADAGSGNARIPVNAVFVWGSSGPEPLRTMGEAEEIRMELVSVRVRDNTYADGDTLVRSIMDSLRGVAVANYLEMKVMGGGPDSLGQDPDGNHYFGLTYLMTYCEGS